ncbi:MAG: shikimate kinase, partial [Candidatus Peregrinibacteria bacterium]
CSGKTHLGQRIAKFLGRRFVDLDREIEKDQGMKVAEIVRRHGWAYFRKIEQKICSFFAGALNGKNRKPLVIATGGGVVTSPANMKALKKNGVNVFVFVDPSVLAARLAKKGDRPSLSGHDPVYELSQVWRERRSLYLRYADVIWDNTSGEVVRENLDKAF